MKKTPDARGKGRVDTVPKSLRAAADRGQLTKAHLQGSSLDQLLRLGAYPPAAAWVEQAYHLVGVPMAPGERVLKHQIAVLKWLRRREKSRAVRGAIVHLTQGLGKTLIAFLYILTTPGPPRPSLIVTTKTALKEWSDCAVKFFGAEFAKKAVLFCMGADLAAVTKEKLAKKRILVTTKEACKSRASKAFLDAEVLILGAPNTRQKGKVVEVRKRRKKHMPPYAGQTRGAPLLHSTRWRYLVCDESQDAVGNPKTIGYRAMMAICADWTMCLSGTPVRNTDMDLWAHLRFLGMDDFASYPAWRKDGQGLRDFHAVYKEAVFSMGYKEAGIRLPAKLDNVERVGLGEEQRQVYQVLLGETRTTFRNVVLRVKGCKYSNVLEMLMRLRQCCICPALLAGKVDMGPELNEWLGSPEAARSGKIQRGVQLLQNAVARKEKAVVFSSFTSAIRALKEAAAEAPGLEEVAFLTIAGEDSQDRREDKLNEFVGARGATVLGMTYRTGGVGVNLQAANHAIFLDPWWTPTAEEQAASRLWRLGQPKAVFTYRLLVNGSIEDRMVEVAEGKTRLQAELFANRPAVGKRGPNMQTVASILGITGDLAGRYL